MFAYSTPGVFYERADAGAPSVAPVRMDVAAFIGIARQGPLHTAVPVNSWRQFVAYFGDVTPAGYLAYAARAFFENGGRRCWIVRVASPAAATASVDLNVEGKAPGWRVKAASPGVWGNDLDFQLRATHRAQTRTLPMDCTPEYCTVASVTGFARGSHVRLIEPGGNAVVRVVSMVDAGNQRLYWVNPSPTLRLPYDAPVPPAVTNSSVLIESTEYTLIARHLGRVVGVYEGLSLIPEHPQYGPAVLPPVVTLASQTPSWQLSATPPFLVLEELRDAATVESLASLDVSALGIVPLSQGTPGADGLAALRLEDFIGEQADPLDRDEVQQRKQRGLAALDPIREVAAVAIPDIHIQPFTPPSYAPAPPCVPDPCLPGPPAPATLPRRASLGDLPPIFDDQAVYRVQSELVLHCERHADRVALLDPPFSTVKDPRLGAAAIRAWRRRFDSSYAALYFPWLEVVDPLRNGAAVTRAIPPCGHVAGYFALSDATVGVHKAPANGALTWVQDLTLSVDDTTHGVLNDEQVDAVRSLPGRGIRVLGARTLSSGPDFRYVNVRRLLIMVERALDLACKWAVFEPNNTATRAKLHLSVTSFLISLWQKGALAGKNPREAFYVRCDETTSPAALRDQGELVVEIGIAPAIPFEFVVVRVGRTDNHFEISEVGTQGGMS